MGEAVLAVPTRKESSDSPMGALVAILQNDPNLLPCQVARLDAHVSLRDGDRQPDAYGFGYHGDGSVLLGKRPTGAPRPLGLADLAGGIEADALLAHARTATVGKPKDENTHPFRFRRWLFAHDGTVEAWERVRPPLVEGLPDFLRRNLMGDTDSEHLFMWFLRTLREEGRMDELDLDATTAARALAATVRQVEAWGRPAGAQRPGRLGLVATNGRIMVAARRGGPLHYALLEGIVPCAVHGIDLRTPESDPRVRPHRTVKAVAFATRLRSTNGFLEVPEASVVAVSRGLQVTVSSI